MEFRYPEDSKSSSEETDRSEVNDDTGMGRSYECVFCKRGFTTAQALGGHMNIHRKDRAKTKPSFGASSSISKVDESYVDLGLYSSIPRGGEGIRNYYSTTREVDRSNYPQSYYPSTIRSPSEVQYADRDVFGEDWRRRSLSLYNNPFYVRQNEDKVHSAQDDELDLELRLGYQP